MKTPSSSRASSKVSHRPPRDVRTSGHAPSNELRSPDLPVMDALGAVDPEWRRALVAQAAYYRAEQRGFEPGYELEDWLAAEAAVDAELTLGHTPVPAQL